MTPPNSEYVEINLSDYIEAYAVARVTGDALLIKWALSALTKILAEVDLVPITKALPQSHVEPIDHD